jgi:hypothetical protein
VLAASTDGLLCSPLQAFCCAAAYRRSGPQLQTLAVQQTALLFDDLVGASKKQLRNRNAERLGGFEVED